jgi:hypothetical protein
LLSDDGMQMLIRVIGILAIGAFIAFTSMTADADDLSAMVPPPFSVPESPGLPPGLPAPGLPRPMPSFSGSGGTGVFPGGLGYALGGSPGGGTSGTNGSGIH